MNWHAAEYSMARRLLLDAPSLLKRFLRLLVLALQLAESKAQTTACDQQAQRLAGTVEELQEKLRQAPTQDAMLSSIESQSQLRQQVSGTVTLCRDSQAKPLQQEALLGFLAAPPGKQQPQQAFQE